MPYSGNLRGRIECAINHTSFANNMQNVFRNLWGFFTRTADASGSTVGADSRWADNDATATGGFVEVARSKGANFLGATAITAGYDYHDGTNPFGNNAWFTVKWKGVGARPNLYLNFHLFVEANASVSENGIQQLINNATSTGGSSAALGVSVGFDSGNSSGATDIFKCSDYTLGTSVRSATRWAATSGNLIVMPRSNSTTPGGTGTVGSHQTNKQNMAKAVQQVTAANPCRFHVVCDDLGMMLMFSQDNTTNYHGIYIGTYVPTTGITVTNPVVMMHWESTWPITTGTSLGTVAGGASQCGGIALRDTAVGTRNFYLDRLSKSIDPSLLDTALHPNKLNTVSEYDGYPLILVASETTQQYGMAGSIDWLREVYGVPSHDTNTTKKRVFIGQTSTGTVKLAVPWDGVTTPGSGVTRGGLDFSRASD